MLFQGYEKLTGGFMIDGLVSVIKETRIPQLGLNFSEALWRII